jgi:hypothetical protein
VDFYSRVEKMRDPTVIMNRSGDDPLTELMELDEIYGWSRRLAILGSLFKKKDNSSKWITIAIIIMFSLGLVFVSIFLLYTFVL